MILAACLGCTGIAAAQHNGTIHGQMAYDSGPTNFGSAFVFRGTYITLDDVSASLGTNYTVGMWFKRQAAPSAVMILRGQGGPANADIPQTWMGVQATGHFVAAPYGSGQTDSNVNVCDGQWHYLQVVYTPTLMTLYVDGNLAGPGTNSQSAVSGGEALGASLDGAFALQDGTYVDEVSYSTGDHHVTAGNLPSSPYTGHESGLVALFHAEQNANDSAITAQSNPPAGGGGGSSNNAVTTNGGTTGTLAKWSAANGLTNSSILEANGNVAVNSALELRGTPNSGAPDTTRQGSYLNWNTIVGYGATDFINNEGGGPGGFMFWNTPASGLISSPLAYLDGTGNLSVGPGTTQAPNIAHNRISVHGGGINVDQEDENPGDPFFNDNFSSYGLTFGHASGEGIASARTDNAQNHYGLDFFTGFLKRMSITQGGSVGIGTINPSALFEVAGNLKISNSGTLVFPDGSTQSTAWQSSASVGFNQATSTADVPGVLRVEGSTAPTINGQGAYLGWNALNGGVGETDIINSQGGGPGGFAFMKADTTGKLIPLSFLDSNGNLGLGTTSPSERLEVIGNIKLDGGSLKFADGSSLASASALSGLASGTNLGLTISAKNLDPSHADGAAALASLRSSWKLLLGWNRTAGGAEQDFVAASADDSLLGGFGFWNQDTSGNVTNLAYLNRGGLALNGNLSLPTGAHLDFADNTHQTTAWTGVVPAQDYADSVDVTGTPAEYEPGDVLAIDPDHPRSFVKVTEPYSTLVGGVYSTKPGLLGRRSSKMQADLHEVPLALNGIVPTKVTTENGPVRVGDLLVSSSRSGYAMKGTDRSRLTGAVLGKALGSVATGDGIIDVLVSLQ